MTDVSEPLAKLAEPPQLLHSGTYALYQTPEGGRVVAYKRTRSAAGDGSIQPVTDAPDDHLPVIPAEALPLISTWLEHGFPPRILALLRGNANPLAMITGLKDMLSGAGGDDDDV